ncbi:OprD family porin [Denitrificimonas sp. JX-1]|uniref:OprD family porin n=1 Tax=Denitrificimonas halotolerans TaxID=3098930 RepID=A0ABU5GMU4_9GAMM|nr:OprD family porin [Denitrificimonas sp. JX-1]MDY7218144.1 OprD family porin [Denitrificimonas sp. JX-1]
MQMIKLSVIALAVAAASTQMAVASQQSQSNGFIEDSKLDAHARVLYMNRDFRNNHDMEKSGERQSYREDLGLGLKAIYESGFTQGTVGFGVDAFGLQGIKLDSGKGRHGNGLFPTDGRSDKAQDNYSQAGGAVKARISNTTLKYGEQFVDLPVLSTDDARLLPETATGFLITSNEIENLELHAGHFTALTAMDQTYHDSTENKIFGDKEKVTLRSLDLVGGRYNFTNDLSAAYFYSDADVGHKNANEARIKKHYTNVNYNLPLANAQNLNFDFNMYNTKFNNKDDSKKSTNNVWSLAAAYNFLDAHTLTFAHQRVTGGNDGGYVYGYDGGGAVYLANDVQYNGFHQKGEKSFQARYDLDMATYGVPGLSFMTRYIRGSNIDSGTRNDGKNWERDIEAKYVLQSGVAKDLSFRVRQATYRANDAANKADNNEVRLIVEYPLSIL